MDTAPRPASADAGIPDPLADLAALPGVDDAVTEAREAVDRLLRHKVMRRKAGHVATEAALRGARASAALEGASWPLERVRAFDPESRAGGTGIVHGALRVSTEAGPLSRTVRQAPLQALARLHVLAAADLEDAAALGRPRGDGPPETAGGPLDVLGLPPAPSPQEVAVRLEGLSALLVQDSAAPALVVAAVVHGEVLALRPFRCANGLVARAAQRLVLHGRGLDTKGVVAPEIGHVELGEAYAESLRGYVSGTRDGVAGWIRHCAQAVRLGARDGIAVCEAMMRG